MTVESEFLRISAARMEMLCSRIEACVGRLTPEQVWTRHSESENAIGNLLLHLNGNLRQWVLSGLGNAPDTRDRHQEFDTREMLSPAELVANLRTTVDEVVRIFRALTAREFFDRITVQGAEVTKMAAIYHVVDHFSGHTFQIIFITKLLTSQDMGFYPHLNLRPA